MMCLATFRKLGELAGTARHQWLPCYRLDPTTKWIMTSNSTWKIQISADVIFFLETWMITYMKLLALCAYVVISVLSFVCVECVN